MDKAVKWLKTRYREDYMTRPGLADALNDWETGERQFNGEVKDRIRSDFRSGFRTFLRDSIGDASIAYAILRNGYSTPEALLALVREVFQTREKAKAEKASQPYPFTKKSHPHLAAAAKEARQEFVAGMKLACRPVDESRCCAELGGN